MCDKIKMLYGRALADQYLEDLNTHILYKHDESGTPGFPYCVAITMYPFLISGLKELGGVSIAPDGTETQMESVEIYELSQADADIILGLIENTHSVYSYDQDILDIITDEVAAFFAGEKTAEDTAAMVQSRVNLYVQEQS